ncbi:MAG TPA: hypothetical protein VNM39_16900 [Verrucomicrobiae bacterium]|nr:hypothetical protein [Verrucomicrobiae bacterium]
MFASAVTVLALWANAVLAHGLLNRSLATDSLAAVPDSSRALATDSLVAPAGRASAPDSIVAPAARADSLVSFPPPRVRAWQVGLVRGDRIEHASLSFALTSALIIITRNRPASAATALAFGVGKELWDQRTSRFDPVDLTADAVGVGLASLLVTPHGP